MSFLKEKIESLKESKEKRRCLFQPLACILFSYLLIGTTQGWWSPLVFFVSPFIILMAGEVFVEGERRIGVILLCWLRFDLD